jgi:hypothetical protein
MELIYLAHVWSFGTFLRVGTRLHVPQKAVNFSHDLNIVGSCLITLLIFRTRLKLLSVAKSV